MLMENTHVSDSIVVILALQGTRLDDPLGPFPRFYENLLEPEGWWATTTAQTGSPGLY